MTADCGTKTVPRSGTDEDVGRTRTTPERAARTRIDLLPLEAIWERWRADRDPDVREYLVDRFFPLVGHVARGLAQKLSSRADVDELTGFGALGLLDAIDRFDSTRGIQFSTFAAHRIRGAIYDGIRAADWAPRTVRRRDREMREDAAQLRHELGREPNESEMATAAGRTLDAHRKLLADLDRAGVCSLDEQNAGNEPTDHTGNAPLERYLADESAEEVRAALGRLNDRERSVIAWSYGDGHSLAEIGKMLGVTESRVCQLRGKALARMRADLTTRGLAPV